MAYFAGVDIGSLGSKSVILDDQRRIVGKAVIATGARMADAYHTCLDLALSSARLARSDLALTIATGYGRKRAAADAQVTEITCHARGASYFFPKTGTVLDIGGQDTKVIRVMNGGDVENFAMNDKCAAGTGRFLEVMARALEVDLDDMGPLSLQSTQAQKISSFCTVFGESEVISHVSDGAEIKDIIRGLHESISMRTVGLMKRIGIKPEITMSGGVARNTGMHLELQRVLGEEINVCEDSQVMGALGAALLAYQRQTGGADLSGPD